MGRSLFDAAPMVVARVAALPASRGDITRTELAPERAGYRERLVDYLRGLLADPLVREAIEVSSTSLSETLDRICSDASIELSKVERAVLAASRYVLRMCSRSTPFGLLAGVAAGSFGEDTKVQLGAAHERFARVDAGWLGGLVGDWQRRGDVRRLLRVTANNLGTVRGDRLVLNYLNNGEHEANLQPVREISVRHTPVVAAALGHARRPVGYRDLCDALRAAFPSGTAEAVDTLLAELIDKGFLLTDLVPHPAGADPAEQVRAILSGTELGDMLGRVKDAIDAYRCTPLGGGRPEFRSAVGMLHEQRRTHRPPVQVELRYDIDFRLPRLVAREAERVVTALCRMSRGNPHEAHLAEYHSAFVERYGTHQTVPILELLDPNVGLDAPAGYQAPESSRRLDRQYPAEPDPQRAGIVAELAWTAARDGTEVLLDEEIIDRLGNGSDRPPPAVVELCVQIFAGSVAALDRGDFTLALAPVGGSTRPGSMIGRFARVLGAQSAIAELIGDDRDGLAVQVFNFPASGRAANVSSVPRLVEHVVPVGMFADRADDSVIDIADVAVGATLRRLYLVSLRTGQRLRPLVPHMLNPRSEMPNVCRLLMDIEQMGTRGMPWWDWGRLDTLPSLPRVRYGRTILAPARWRPDRALVTSKEAWSDWCARLAAWRERWAVPARVEATIADQRVELDLDVDLHRQLLRHELRKFGGVALFESLAAQGLRLNWLGGHAAEFVVSLTRSPAATARSERIDVPPRRSTVRYEPGSEWLYAKLYVAEASHDALLAHELPTLLAELPDRVDRWHFVRYRDADAHLRLRFHGDPALLTGTLLPRLRTWAAKARERRLVGWLALDTYVPEINRYGGPEVMAAAEWLFHADSVSVITQLRWRARRSRELPIEVLGAMNVVDLLRRLGDWDWTSWATHELARSPVNGIDRKHRALVDPGGSWERLAGLPGGRELKAAWERRAGAAAEFGRRLFATCDSAAEIHSVVASVVHMHLNRLIGVDRQREERALAIVRERAHSLRVRSAGAR